MTVLLVFLGLLIAVNAGYHEEIGIPLAAKLKTAEEKIFAQEPKVGGRIAGGEEVNIGDFPFLAGLILNVKNSLSVCGSTVLTKTHMLTAAHCLTDVEKVIGVFGSIYMFKGGKRVRAATWKSHPQHNEKTNDHDIGVVTLKHSVKFSNLIQPISLPARTSESGVVGQNAWAFGWGITTETQDFVPDDTQLHVIRLSIITEMSCKRFYGNFYPTVPSVCTRGKVGVGTCPGDSGGPLIIAAYGRLVQVGVASAGHRLCASGFPGIFTKIFNHVDFIIEITGETK